MSALKLFVSHSSKYKELAFWFAAQLEKLAPQEIEVKISENMPGGDDWHDWIEANVRAADVFVLLYPHPTMGMDWCNYELGRFVDTGGRVVCIRNTNIDQPPPTFAKRQGYKGNVEELTKFLHELFVTNVLTPTRATPLNPEVDHVGTAAHKLAHETAESVARLFADARVHEQLYERRIEIAVRYKGRAFDPEASTIDANADALALLGLGRPEKVKWSTLRQARDERVTWPLELEKEMAAMTDGGLPPTLSPFRTASGIFLPVIARTQSVDGVLCKVAVIFIEASQPQLEPLFDWPLPERMPREFGALILLFRMLFRARWDTIEPLYQEVRFRSPTPERCKAIARQVGDAYLEISRSAQRAGLNGLDAFFAIFDRSLHAGVRDLLGDWTRQVQGLKSACASSGDVLSDQLLGLRKNNTAWMQLASRQFAIWIEGFTDTFEA